MVVILPTMWRKIRTVFVDSLSGPGLLGWLLLLYKPANAALTMAGSVDLLSTHGGAIGKFLETGWGTSLSILFGAIIIGYAILKRGHISAKAAKSKRRRPQTNEFHGDAEPAQSVTWWSTILYLPVRFLYWLASLPVRGYRFAIRNWIGIGLCVIAAVIFGQWIYISVEPKWNSVISPRATQARLKDFPARTVFIGCENESCKSLSQSFDKLFDALGWPHSTLPRGSVGVWAYGIEISPNDPTTQSLKGALEQFAQFQVRVIGTQNESNTAEPITIIIGAKPR